MKADQAGSNRPLRSAAAIAVLLCSLAASPASAGPAPLSAPLQGLGFLLGRWVTAVPGQVKDTGGTAKGEFAFNAEAAGAAILRRDHAQLFDRAGAPAGELNVAMLIYAEGDGVRADFVDGQHVIHYDRASIDPGRSAQFTSPAGAHAPSFRLTYALEGQGRLHVEFSVAIPGGGWATIADGVAAKVD